MLGHGHSKGGPRLGADGLTDCRLQSLTTFKIKWSISNQLITLKIINSGKPKPQPRENALTNASASSLPLNNFSFVTKL